jgi:hypothetical protein
MPTTRNVATLIFGDVEVLDFCGPFEVFTVAEKPGPVLARGGLSVNPHHRLPDCPRPDLRRGRVWSVRPILSYASHGSLVGGDERPRVQDDGR